MPDSGHNTALVVNADGTVQVPSNIDINGAIAAGDFATHSDLDAAVALRAYADLSNASHLGLLDFAWQNEPNALQLTALQTATWLTGNTWTAPPGVGAADFVFVGMVAASGPGGGWVRMLYRDVTVAGPFNQLADWYNDCLQGEYALALAVGSVAFPANGHDYELTAQYVRSNNPGTVYTKNAALAVFRA